MLEFGFYYSVGILLIVNLIMVIVIIVILKEGDVPKGRKKILIARDIFLMFLSINLLLISFFGLYYIIS